MLEELDAIDWSQLTHAYGPAEDVPALLRALVEGTDSEQSAALGGLTSSIWHQGTVYEATAAAVPFLAEVALAPQVPVAVRAQVLYLLLQIARGGSYSEAHRLDSPNLDLERRWVDDARAAVRQELSGLFALLEDPSPAVRMATVGLVVEFPQHSTPMLSLVRHLHLRATDGAAAALLELAVARLEGGAMSEALLDHLAEFSQDEDVIDLRASQDETAATAGEQANDLGELLTERAIIQSLPNHEA